jgi:hypothetical protein
VRLGPLPELAHLFEAVYQSVLPLALELGVTTEAESERWLDDFSRSSGAHGHTALWSLLIGTWKRKTTPSCALRVAWHDPAQRLCATPQPSGAGVLHRCPRGGRGPAPSDGSIGWIAIRPGEILHLPGGVKHAWRNRSQEPAVSLAVTEESLAAFYREVGTPAGTPPAPDSAERFVEASLRRGHWLGTPEENAAVGLGGSFTP